MLPHTLLFALAALAPAQTQNTAPRYDVHVRHRDHWDRHATYRDPADARRAARHLQAHGFVVRVDRTPAPRPAEGPPAAARGPDRLSDRGDDGRFAWAEFSPGEGGPRAGVSPSVPAR